LDEDLARSIDVDWRLASHKVKLEAAGRRQPGQRVRPGLAMAP